MLAVAALAIGALICVPIGLAVLKSWIARRIVVYVKKHYPEDWHLPVHLRTLSGIVLLLFLIIIVLAFEMVKGMFSALAWPLIIVTALTCFCALVASDVETRLLAGARHEFVARQNTLHLLLLTHEQRPFFDSRVLRMCARLRIIPAADTSAWPCRTCGKPRFSATHGFLESR